MQNKSNIYTYNKNAFIDKELDKGNWVTKEEKVFPIKNMDNSHLKNALKHFANVLETRKEYVLEDPEPDFLEIIRITEKRFNLLKKEAKRRGQIF